MSELKATPGPWGWDGPPDNIHVTRDQEPNTRICFLASNGPTEANANLISAAPALYEALMDARCVLNALLSRGDESALKLLRKVEDALSLARGEKTEGAR